MPVLCEQRSRSAVPVEDTQRHSNGHARENAQVRTSVRALRIIASLAPDRREKVMAIRRQLADGTYDPDGRFPVAFVRLLGGIVPERELASEDQLPPKVHDSCVMIAT